MGQWEVMEGGSGGEWWGREWGVMERGGVMEEGVVWSELEGVVVITCPVVVVACPLPWFIVVLPLSEMGWEEHGTGWNLSPKIKVYCW